MFVALGAAITAGLQACTDDLGGQFRRGFVDIPPPLKADAQLAKALQTSHVCALQPFTLAYFAALNTSPDNSAGNASLSEIGTTALVVVAFVRRQRYWHAACEPRQARNGWYRVYTPLGRLGVLLVCAADQDHQGHVSGINNNVLHFASNRACLCPSGLRPVS